MSEEAEKRLHSVMDKLFHSPKPKPNSPSSYDAQSSKGKKRPNPMCPSAIELKLRKDVQKSTAPVEAPLCRPWDREDLMKRLATFKSMMWFAKPQVISAVNCARRGWVNVDIDIIACEACGARLLFSTPSSWTQQQVEKAALVFSLKLENGHKLLCPWMHNACDEMLAQFPPATVQDLVDGYKERSSALLQLVALPLISSAAINYMRTPQLENFLTQSSVLESDNISADSSPRKYLGSESGAVSANLYFQIIDALKHAQAQKLISLCGWKPRSLPYVVDTKDRQCKSTKVGNHFDLSYIVTNMKTPSTSIHSSPDNSMPENEDLMASSELLSKHSVVLECNLCGATVGLWAFSTVPRPTEFLRLVGNTEVSGESNAFDHIETDLYTVTDAPGIHDSGKENHVNSAEAIIITDSCGTRSSNGRSLNLNLTIAGGPPPTEQNFRATISIPVIGQNLRSWFTSEHDFRDRSCVNKENGPLCVPKNSSFLEGRKHTENDVTAQVVQPESMGLQEIKGHGDGQNIATSNDQSPCLNNISKEDEIFTDSNSHMPLDRPNVDQQELGFPETSMPDSIIKDQSDSTQDAVQTSGQHYKLTECADDVEMINPIPAESADNVETVNPTATESADNIGTVNPTATESADNTETINPTAMDSPNNEVRDSCLSSSDANTTIKNSEGKNHSEVQNVLNTQPNSQGYNLIKDREHVAVNNEGVASYTAHDLKQQSVDKAMEFDPIWQHRHFCPWVAASGSAAPGWQQTLSALQHRKDFSHSSPSIIKVDDPIASVRKIFSSSSAKRMRPAHGLT